MASFLSAKHFHDEAAAYAFVEKHLWAGAVPVCPKCGVVGQAGKLEGKSTRVGLYKCYACRKPFRVTVGTIFEASHIPLRLWLQAIFLMCGSKKGISANQLHRTLGIQLKSAWFMAHRIREAMKSGPVVVPMMGGPGEAVEIDETFLGHDKDKPARRGYAHKFKVLSLIDRKRKRAFSVVIDDLKMRTIRPILEQNVHPESVVMTDEAGQYSRVGWHFARHAFVRHRDGEYVRYERDNVITTNTAEGFFSIFKRGMKGIYQHCAGHHLHRYLGEFDFRYNERGVTDVERTTKALRGVVGKRLTYRTTAGSKQA